MTERFGSRDENKAIAALDRARFGRTVRENAKLRLGRNQEHDAKLRAEHKCGVLQNHLDHAKAREAAADKKVTELRARLDECEEILAVTSERADRAEADRRAAEAREADLRDTLDVAMTECREIISENEDSISPLADEACERFMLALTNGKVKWATDATYCKHEGARKVGKYESGNCDEPVFWCPGCGALRHGDTGNWEQACVIEERYEIEARMVAMLTECTGRDE